MRIILIMIYHFLNLFYINPIRIMINICLSFFTELDLIVIFHLEENNLEFFSLLEASNFSFH